MKNSKISWTHHTFNCWWGCVKVGGSPACEYCYAETWAKRTGFKIWGQDAERRYFGDKHWSEPLKWNAEAEKAGERQRVFCMSMGDWAEGRPEQATHLERWWDLCLETPWLDKLMLTKRPQLINKLCPLRSQTIWHGVTAETQAWLDLRWGLLRRVDAEIYWLSIEPLFESIKLPADFLALGKRAWVIVGGESGGHARPMHPDWARSLRDQCQEAGVPFHFKQWGEWAPATEAYGVVGSRMPDTGEKYRWISWNGQTQNPSCHGLVSPVMAIARVGKKAAGRLLDGREWNEFPIPAPDTERGRK